MKGISLLGVLLIGRLAALVGNPIPDTGVPPVAWIWQDMFVVLMFALCDVLMRGWRGLWVLYGILAAITALNVPLLRLFGAPLNPRLLAATRPELGDSIQHHLTSANIACMASVLVTALALPWLLARVRLAKRTAIALWLGGLFIATLGFAGASKAETAGLHRSGILALIPRTPARLSLAGKGVDWRKSPLERDLQAESQRVLKTYHGRAAGRNVVLVMLESTGARHAGPWRPAGAPDPTPHLTSLCGHAVLWENAYAVFPESIRGLSSVLRSEYPILDGRPARVTAGSTPSLAQMLAASGRSSALFHAGRFDYLGMRELVASCGFDVMEDAGDIGGNRESSFGVDEPAVIDRLLGWVDELPAGNSFFAVYLPIAGHHPYEAAEGGPFEASTDAGRHANAVYTGDAALGRLVAGLKARGLFEKTVLLIAGDHGEAFGEHPGNHGHTLQIREENVKVPLLVVAPGLIEGPVWAGGIASLVDCAPTLLDLVGLEPPRSWEGCSLFRAAPDVACFLTDYDRRWLGLRDGRWKFLWDLDAARGHLYDLMTDPDERYDLARVEPGRVERYRRHVVGWAAANQ